LAADPGAESELEEGEIRPERKERVLTWPVKRARTSIGRRKVAAPVTPVKASEPRSPFTPPTVRVHPAACMSTPH
jgi:hypothetical protein